MSVLVDTSVWIRFLSNRAAYASRLDERLGRDEVSGHDFVYGELLIGDKGGRKALLAEYARMDQAPVIPHPDVVAFVRDRKLHGRGIRWIDVHPIGVPDRRLPSSSRVIDVGRSKWRPMRPARETFRSEASCPATLTLGTLLSSALATVNEVFL